MSSGFRALVTEKAKSGEIASTVKQLDDGLPEGDVLVGIEWAGFNYKDALVLTGQGGLVDTYPHVGGIDFSGRVIESRDARYHPGQAVLLTGWRVGETQWGGFSTRARVSADWLMPVPKKLSTRDVMVLGTAGLTARLAITRLRGNGLSPAQGEVLVSGANSGVGSLTVMLLAQLGFKVIAETVTEGSPEFLKALGAKAVVPRDKSAKPSAKPLESARWAAVVDAVGGPMLGHLLKEVNPGGGVAILGNMGGTAFAGSVIPFVLRGISLFGIDSVTQPFDVRFAAWDQLQDQFLPSVYEPGVTEVGLEDLPALAERFLKGGVNGRVIVNPRLPDEEPA